VDPKLVTTEKDKIDHDIQIMVSEVQVMVSEVQQC
jgi:hypothetical protein